MTLEMKVEQRETGILIRFPSIREHQGNPFDKGMDVPDFVLSENSFDHGRVVAHPHLYLALRAEESAFPAHPEERDVTQYRGYHPTTVAHLAFNDHRKFTISPEAVGAQILLDFGEYVRDNPGPCGPIFDGNMDAKQRIKVWLPEGEILKNSKVFCQTVAAWEKELLRHTDGRIRDKLHPRFSEQNAIVDAVYGALLMGAAKAYYDYEFGSLCGIPEIQVTGTKEDWKRISDLVAGLESVPELRPISAYYAWANEEVLSRILGLYDGEEDHEFWSSLFHYKSESGKDHQFTGWLPSLNLYTFVRPDRKQIVETRAGQDNPGRWTKRGSPQPIHPSTVPVVNINLISDAARNSDKKESDTHLSLYAGFTSVAYTDGFLRPVLGIDAYEKNLKVRPEQDYAASQHVNLRGERMK